MNLPTWPSLQEANIMSTQQNKKPKICQLGHQNQSSATKDPHLQTTQTPTPQQNRSPNETGENRNEHRKGHRNKIALSAPQADNPSPSSHLNRNSNPGKPSHAPTNLTILAPSTTNHMEEYSASLPNTNYTTMQHHLPVSHTNRNQAQGKPLENITKPTTPASSINNQIEEYTVPPSPPIHTIARKEPPLTSKPTPKPQVVGQAIPNVASPLDSFYTEDITPPSCRLTSNHSITKQPQVPQLPANNKTDHSIRSNDDMHSPLTDCNMPNPDRAHSDGQMSTQKHKKPKMCQLGHPNQSPASKDPHLQRTQTPNPQQNRSPNETGKNRNEHRKGHRNKLALSGPQADNPPPSSHLNRNSNQGKPSHAPTNLTILVPSTTNHMEEYSASLPNTNYPIMQHHLLDSHTNRNQEQGKPLDNTPKPTTPASSITNKIEENTVPLFPPIHTIAREEPLLTSEPIPCN